MTQTAGTPADDLRGEELRLALVLNGGVSLAVWMGGVAFELNRLVRETHPVYRGLLELTDTSARIDVISGTSAGGVNGAALALAQLHDTSLYGLREVWLSQAGLEQLMRDPGEDDPPSLLRGDDYFLPAIERALGNIAQGPAAPKDGVPMMLSLTTTLLNGIGEAQLDDFGAVVEDTVHRAHFVFERRGGAPDDAFAPGRDVVAQLARAARAGASFPVAFEPVLYDPGVAPFTRKPLQARFGKDQPVEQCAYLVDGGILDNKPFAAALEGISKLPADGNTRRVLAYVVPDPKAAVEAPKPGPDGKLPVPTLAAVAFQSVVGIPGTQSIADQLADIREHNDYMRRRWQRITGLLARSPGDAGTTAPRHRVIEAATLLFPAYRVRRLDGAIDYLLGELQRSLAETADGRRVQLRRATRWWLRALWLETHADAELWGTVIPTRFEPQGPLLDAEKPVWQWGQYTLEFMAEVVIDVLRRTQRLADVAGRWQEMDESRVDGPALAPEPPPEAASWEQMDERPSPAGRRHRRAAGATTASSLGHLWQQAYAINLKLRERRQSGSEEARAAGRAGFLELLDTWRRLPPGTQPTAEARQLIGKLRSASTSTPVERLADAHALCSLLAELREPIRRIVAARVAQKVSQPQAQVRADVAEGLRELEAYADYFFGDDQAPPSADTLAWRLLALEVIEVGAGTRDHRPNVGAELVQISARQRSPWGGPDEPARKLAGMGLAHFAAFYKRSWRANDWLFGRLDGIDRAVRIALNPDRLQRRYGRRRVLPEGAAQDLDAASYVLQYVEGLAVHGARPELQAELSTAWEREREQLVDELAWLNRPATMPPPVLEHCAAALTRRLHLEVLMQELPGLAAAIDQDHAIGAPASNAGKELRASIAPNQPPDPRTAITVLDRGVLGSDALRGEVGSDHFTRTVSQGVAVAHATASSASSGLKALKVLLKLTEWPIRVFHGLAHRLSQDSRTNAALEGAMIGIGITLVIAAITAEKLPAALATLGWGLLAGGLAASLLRHRTIGIVAVAISVLVLVLIDPATGLSGLLGGAALLLLLRFSGGLGALLLILAAAWWSAGRPGFDVIAQLPCVPPLQRLTACAAPAGDAAQQLFAIAVPALLVSLIVLCTLWSRHARRLRRWLAARWRQAPRP